MRYLVGIARAAEISKQAVRFKNEQVILRSQVENERNELARAYARLRDANNELDQANLTLADKVAKRTAQIERLTKLDTLTGLLNRSVFITELNQLINTYPDNPLAVLFVALKGFKAINDALGHRVGDEVLRTVSERLSKLAQEASVCRWGGGEFVLAINYTTEQSTLKYTKDLLKKVTTPIDVDGHFLKLDASIGIALYPEHAKLPIELAEKGDVAMYKVKKFKGEGIQTYNEELKTEVVNEQRLITGLRESIKQHQLFIVYQPIIDSKTREVWGEALVRWQFQTELVRPDQFIPLAEKSGFILELGLWVLEQACTELLLLEDCQNKHLTVNVSALQMQTENFFAQVQSVLETTGFDPHKLHLEITESALMTDDEQVMESVMSLKAMGISLSIDDFGTEYSNLSQLTVIPANSLKIDKIFVDASAKERDVILRAVSLIASELKFLTVAEGVETDQQVIEITARGIDLLQGYYFAKPMNLGKLAQWLKQQSN